MKLSEEAATKQLYVVLQYTLCDGWTNTWFIEEDGISFPHTFESEAAAQTAIDEFLAEIELDIKNGERDPEDGFDAEEFRIAPVDHD